MGRSAPSPPEGFGISRPSKRTSSGAGPTLEFVSGSVEETQAFGERLGRLLGAGDVVALSGELGSGKTTLIQGIARGSGRDPQTVKSPTFVLQREYPGDLPLVHVDGYRLAGAEEAAWLDLDLMFAPHKITVIEWAERFAGLLPEDVLEAHLSHLSTNRRRITLQATGPRSMELVRQLSNQTTSAEGGSASPARHVAPGPGRAGGSS